MNLYHDNFGDSQGRGVGRSSTERIHKLGTCLRPRGAFSASALFSQQSSNSWLRREVAKKSVSPGAAAQQPTLGGVAAAAAAAAGMMAAAAQRGGYQYPGPKMAGGLQTEANWEGAGVALRALLQRGL
jgi:hypothetical protein